MKISNKETLDKAGERKSPFLTLEDATKIRIVSDVHGIKEHRILVNGQNRMIACPRENEMWRRETEGEQTDAEIPKCPLCEKKYPAKVAFLAMVINRANGEVKVLKKGTTVFGPIMEYNEEIGDVRGYDLNIKKKGKGLETEYTIIPLEKDNQPISGDETGRIESSDIDIGLMTTPREYDEIVEIIGENYPVYVPK